MLYLILRQGPAETNHRRSTTAQQLLQYIKSLAGDVSDIVRRSFSRSWLSAPSY